MAFNNQQAPFWDFVRSMQNSGAGVDHTSQSFNMWGPGPEGHPLHGFDFPFGGPGPFGRGGFGRRGRRCGRRDGSRNRSAHGERSRSPRREGEQAENEDREARPHFGPHHHGRHGSRHQGEGQSGDENSDTEARGHSPRPHGGRHRGRHGPGGCGGFGGRGRGGWGYRGGWGGPHGHHPPPPPPPFGGPGGPFDLSALIESLSAHPLAQAFRSYAEQNGFNAPDAQRSGETLVPEDADMENSFIPPIDVFTTENAYVLHVALPGVHWDAEKSTLTMAGVVYRPGDEKFLESLTKKERKVGAFERTMKLPLNADDNDEIDGDNITAKLEDGVLVVTVPKVEKEESWTEIKRVEIE
ncbi:hypothetical protein ACMFMF_005036 [Clarireedia jacksonii]